ncbi:MAG: hypothetical protein WCE30_04740, partial [Mycobacterium sp.]
MSDSDPDTDRFATVGPGLFRSPVTGPFTIPEPEPAPDTFDPFDTNTWHFKTPPAPWYRVGRTRLLLTLVAGAAVALVISMVLLATRKEPADDSPAPTPSTSTAAPSTTTTATAPTSAPPPPPPPA